MLVHLITRVKVKLKVHIISLKLVKETKVDSIDLKAVRAVKAVLIKDKLLSSLVVPLVSLLLALNLVLKDLDSIRDLPDSSTNKEILPRLDNKDSLVVLKQVVVAPNLRVVILVTNIIVLRPLSRPKALVVSIAHNLTKLLSLDLRDLSTDLLVLDLLHLQTLHRDLVLRPQIDLNQAHRDRLDLLSDLLDPTKDFSVLLVPAREM